MPPGNLARRTRIAAVVAAAVLSLAVALWLAARLLSPEILPQAGTGALLAVVLLVLLPPSVLVCWILDRNAAKDAPKPRPKRSPRAIPRRVGEAPARREKRRSSEPAP